MSCTLNVWNFIHLFVIVLTFKTCIAKNCFNHYEDYKCRLGTKTPYRFIGNYNDSPLTYTGCTEKKIWILVRHGTRYPGKKELPVMLKELPRLQQIILENSKNDKTILSAKDVVRLSTWKLNLTEDDFMKLTQEGENEMIDLAERYQSRFPTIMPEIYTNQTYKFKYTATQRAEESAKYFATGLFGWHNSQKVWYLPAETKDPILRFYKRCTRWRKQIGKNPNAYAEKNKFIKTKFFANTLRNISERIGHEVDYETANLMYSICAFETAWNKDEDSVWCKVFSLEDFKVLEYVNDLKYYWRDGYGYTLTYEQACPALNDMFNFFSSKDGPSVTTYFSHSGTLLKLLALLRVARDHHSLTHETYSSHKDVRSWRTSLIDAFASNLAFVLYDCTSNGPSILFMHQERPVTLPGCYTNTPCPMSIMKSLYPHHDDQCPFDAMCHMAELDIKL